ncbi:MAG: hypothetical protein AAB971_01075 [Patescibacteria group bacterium]
MRRSELLIPKLNEAPEGVYSLGVPIINGAVQVRDYGEMLQKGRLSVKATRDLVKIRREDGKNLAVDVHVKTPQPPSEANAEPVIKVRQVFDQPIPELLLYNLDNDGLWLPDGENLEVAYEEGLSDFAYFIDFHANNRHARDLQDTAHQTEPAELVRTWAS